MRTISALKAPDHPARGGLGARARMLVGTVSKPRAGRPGAFFRNVLIVTE
ncbi:MAG: hypothetical protein MI923_14070 [Phycisphaerales bacterium]|nr:hypothetical protein [Phycisphaerales bacterium]